MAGRLEATTSNTRMQRLWLDHRQPRTRRGTTCLVLHWTLSLALAEAPHCLVTSYSRVVVAAVLGVANHRLVCLHITAHLLQVATESLAEDSLSRSLAAVVGILCV